MKKIVAAVTALVCIVTMCLPVMAASPTASSALEPGVLGAQRSPEDRSEAARPSAPGSAFQPMR